MKVILSAFFALIVASSAQATQIDYVEKLFGPTNMNAVSGNGGMTVGVSSRGEITLLRWPSPSYFDHVRYATKAVGSQSETSARELPHMGAAENMGVFAGIYYETSEGGSLTWLRDDEWKVEQSYKNDGSDTIVNKFARDDVGLEVTQTVFVLPESDVVAMRISPSKIEGSPVKNLKVVFFESLAPCLRKTEKFSGDDYRNDNPRAGRPNDFGLLYYSKMDALVHFRPAEETVAEMKEEFAEFAGSSPSREQADRYVEGIDGKFEPGVFLAIGAEAKSAGRQVGPYWYEEEGTDKAADAFYDAGDGALSEMNASAAPADAALLFDGSGDVTVYLAAAETAGAALGLLDRAKARGFDEHLKAAENYWSDWISAAKMPDTDDRQVIKISKRALITIKNGTDRSSGAIVAAVTTQPPYAEDWPRDGAFINYALDLAGYYDMVTKHLRFYAEVMRREDEAAGPAGTYWMNYYADGVPGGPIPFEIDNAGLVAWSMWSHSLFLARAGREREAADFLREIYPALALTAQSLADCRDEANKLQCRANEDDNPEQTQGLQGAVTVYLALRCAAAAGRTLGEAQAQIDGWTARAEELREAVLENLYDEEKGTFAADGGPGAWLIWPVVLFPYDDERMLAQADYIFEPLKPVLGGETEGGAYAGKTTSALARIWRGNEEKMALLRPFVDVLLKTLPTETGHYGEVFVTLSKDPLVFENRVAITQLWHGVIAYITAVFFYGLKDGDLPPADEASESFTLPPPEREGGGCGCAAGAGAMPAVAAVLLLLATATWRRARA